MGERGNRLLRIADRYIGIPLTAPSAIFRCMERMRQVVRHEDAFVTGKQKIGIFCPGALGDAVLLTALIVGIRREAPFADIDFIGSQANAHILSLIPYVHEMASFPVSRIGAIISHIRKRNYDVFIDASQWARIGAIVAACSGAKKTIGFTAPGQWRSLPFDLKVPHRSDCHELENFLALGRAIWPALDGRPKLNLPRVFLPAHISRTIFCHMWPAPGAGRCLKQWPGSHWSQLINALLDRGFDIQLTGSAADATDCQTFLQKYFPGAKRISSTAGIIPLPELAARFSQCTGVFSVNTGIMHLAAVAGAPTIGLHGATNPLRWGPVGENTASLLPRKGEKAYLHLGFEYPPGVKPSMEHLPVEDVLAAFDHLVATP